MSEYTQLRAGQITNLLQVECVDMIVLKNGQFTRVRERNSDPTLSCPHDQWSVWRRYSSLPASLNNVALTEQK